MARLIVALACLIFVSCNQKKTNALIEISKYHLQEAVSLEKKLIELKANIEADKEGIDYLEAQSLFKQARVHYKRIESVVEFHFPGVAEAMNGPALPEADEYDDKVIEPTGFQVIEEMLFPRMEAANYPRLMVEMNLFISMMARLKGQLESNSWVAENIFEASRLQLLRIMSLGITGFDSPVAFQSMQEARASLSGMKEIILYFENQSDKRELVSILTSRFEAADKYLATSTDFNSFDRGEFIIDFIKPLSASLYDFQNACRVPNNKWLSPVDMTKTNFASASTIEPMWFAPTYNRELKNKSAVASLGKILFFDPILSGNNLRSCASCHQPKKGFTDGKAKSLAFNSKGNIERNAPTVINSGFQKNQFVDSRFQFLEDQITDVLANDKEMHGQLSQSASTLQKSDEYRDLFAAAFYDNPEKSITKERVQIAIATYIRSLNGLLSKVDQYLEGEKAALSADEIGGFNLFMGKAKCATCHFMPLFNGSIPPSYLETESEIIGVPLMPDTVKATLDSDIGKFLTFNRELHKNAFKIPTVRNASLTAPYMHNGVYKTLEEVIDFYNRGGGAGIGIELTNQTLPPDPLHLSKKEKEQLVYFIHALTDTIHLTSMPKCLPRFKDDKIDRRKMGGEY
jgi:cytochrome c peroxidase